MARRQKEDTTKSSHDMPSAVALAVTFKEPNERKKVLARLYTEDERSAILHNSVRNVIATVPDACMMGVLPPVAMPSTTLDDAELVEKMRAESAEGCHTRSFRFFAEKASAMRDDLPEAETAVIDKLKKCSQAVEIEYMKLYVGMEAVTELPPKKINPDGSQVQPRARPKNVEVEGTYSFSDVVGRAMPYVVMNTNNLKHSSRHVPAVKLADGDDAPAVSRDAALVARLLMDIDVLKLPAKGSAEAVTMYNDKVRSALFGLPLDGATDVQPRIRDGKIEGFASPEGDLHDMCLRCTVDLDGVRHVADDTDPIDGRYLVTPNDSVIDLVVALTDRLVGAEYVPEAVRAYRKTPSGKRPDIDVKEVVLKYRAREYAPLAKDVTPAGVNNAVKAWQHKEWRTPTVTFRYFSEKRNQMVARNMLLPCSTTEQVPIINRFLTRFGPQDAKEHTCDHFKLVCKDLNQLVSALSKVASGEVVAYTLDRIIKGAGTPKAKRRRTGGGGASSAAARAVASEPSGELETAVSALHEATNAMHAQVDEIGKLRALWEGMDVAKLAAFLNAQSAAAPASASGTTASNTEDEEEEGGEDEEGGEEEEEGGEEGGEEGSEEGGEENAEMAEAAQDTSIAASVVGQKRSRQGASGR
jgi:hypothetical protein